MTTISSISTYRIPPKKLPKIFDEDDFRLMLDSLDHYNYPNSFYGLWIKNRDKCILSFLYYTGMRPLEVLRLRYDDFNVKDMTVHVRGVNNHVKKDRILPIPQPLVLFMEQYLQFGRFGDWLFPSHNYRNNPLSYSAWKYIMREKILKPSKLYIKADDERIPRTRSYSLRASFATRLLRNSGNTELVKKFLGHSDYRSLHKYIYLYELSGDNLEKARKSMV